MNVVAIARLYRGVLNESLAAARATVAIDPAAEAKLSQAFSASIPTTVPPYLAGKAAGRPTLPAELRADAVRLLVRLCLSLPPPCGAFVAAVAEKAKGLGRYPRQLGNETAETLANMAKPTIRLLIFKGCPLAHAARDSLQKALAEVGITIYQEIDILDPATPEDLRRWASPTILVDGVDISGGDPADNVACRALDSIPSTATIVSSIRRSAGQSPPRAG